MSLRAAIGRRVLLERVMTLTELGCAARGTACWSHYTARRCRACRPLRSSIQRDCEREPGRSGNNYARSRDFLRVKPVRASLYISQPCVQNVKGRCAADNAYRHPRITLSTYARRDYGRRKNSDASHPSNDGRHARSRYSRNYSARPYSQPSQLRVVILAIR